MFVSCSKNELEDVAQEQNGAEGVYTYKLHFNYQIEGETQTRTSYTWNRNDEVYISFSNGGSNIEGVAKYDGSDWVISSSQPIPVKTSSTSCVATYIESGSQNAQTLPYQGSGVYTHASSDDDVYVYATVEPQTWRIRFQGTNGTTISLSSAENDFEYYNSYRDGKIYYSKSSVTLTVSGGYTPYIYGRLLSSGDAKITINNGGNNYTRQIKSGELSVGKSAVMTIPTESNYQDLGWQKIGGQSSAQLYREPCIEWGATKSRIKSFMSGYTLKSEDSETLMYNGKDKEDAIQYGFKNGGLYIVVVGLRDTKVNLADIKEHLSQSYELFVETSDQLSFTSADFSTLIYVEHSSGVYTIMYMDVTQLFSDDYFEEPYVSWGTSRSAVKNEMAKRGYTIMKESNSATDDYMVAYAGQLMEDCSLYLFGNSQQLYEADVVLEADIASVEDIRSFVESSLSYSFMGTNSNGDAFFYASPNSLTCVIIGNTTLSSGSVLTLAQFIDMANITTKAKTRVKSSGVNQYYEYNYKDITRYSDGILLKAARQNSMKYMLKKLRSLDIK